MTDRSDPRTPADGEQIDGLLPQIADQIAGLAGAYSVADLTERARRLAARTRRGDEPHSPPARSDDRPEPVAASRRPALTPPPLPARERPSPLVASAQQLAPAPARRRRLSAEAQEAARWWDMMDELYLTPGGGGVRQAVEAFKEYALPELDPRAPPPRPPAGATTDGVDGAAQLLHDARAEVRRIVAEAQAQARRIVQQAVAQAERVKSRQTARGEPGFLPR